jgi:hypothetical protein
MLHGHQQSNGGSMIMEISALNENGCMAAGINKIIAKGEPMKHGFGSFSALKATTMPRSSRSDLRHAAAAAWSEMHRPSHQRGIMNGLPCVTA